MLSIYNYGLVNAGGVGKKEVYQHFCQSQPPPLRSKKIGSRELKGFFMPELAPPNLPGGRRFSPWLRSALLAAQEAVAAQAASNPAAWGVISATAFGSLQHTGAFLENLIRKQEQDPQPANFIFSVHNAAATQVAQALGAKGYNLTFSAMDTSFEHALLAAAGRIQQGPEERLVVLGGDEWHPWLQLGLEKTGFWKTPAVAERPLPGEGMAALLVGPAKPGLLRIRGVWCGRFSRKAWNHLQERAQILAWLKTRGLSLDQVDSLFTSESGAQTWDRKGCAVWDTWKAAQRIPRIRYKAWTGEYPTASAQAMALAAMVLSGQHDGLTAPQTDPGSWKTILIYNRSRFNNAALVVLQK